MVGMLVGNFFLFVLKNWQIQSLQVKIEWFVIDIFQFGPFMIIFNVVKIDLLFYDIRKSVRVKVLQRRG